MGSPSPAGSKVKKESPISTRVGPHRRTSSVASSCVSLESGDQDVVQSSPVRNSNGLLGKSPAASSTSSPKTPAGAQSVSSPAAMKKRRSSIGGAEDLVRGLDFGTSSPPVEEKKHPFLTRGGGHKKVVAPAVATQTSSPVKKTSPTPPGKEKVVAGRALALASALTSRKSGDAKRDVGVSTLARSVSAEGSNEGSCVVVVADQQVTPKKSSPRASLDGKVLMAKSPSPRPTNTKPKSVGINNDSPLEAETTKSEKFSPSKPLDGKIRKPASPLQSTKSKPGLTPFPKPQMLAKSRQQQDYTPSPPQPVGRVVRSRTEKAAWSEELARLEVESVGVSASSENEHELKAKSEEDGTAKEMLIDDHGSTLLMVEGDVGDEDMSALDHGGDTSWLSEDLPCMFSSLSPNLPEPDDSSSSLLGDPPEVVDHEPSFLLEPDVDDINIMILQGERTFLAHPNDDVIAAAEEMTQISKPDSESSYNPFPSFELETEGVIEEDTVMPVAVSQKGEPMAFKFATQPDDAVSTCSTGDNDESNNVVVTETIAREASLESTGQATANMATGGSVVGEEERGNDLHSFLLSSVEGRSEPLSSQSVEAPTEVSQAAVAETWYVDSERSAPADAIPALQEEGRLQDDSFLDQLVAASSDDESFSEEFMESSCGAQLNLQQSFDDAAEPAAVLFSRNGVDAACDTLPREDTFCDIASEQTPTPTVDSSQEPASSSTNGDINLQVTKLPEFAEEPHAVQELGGTTFPPTHGLDKDMMIFDFEEYWTRDVGDESSSQQSDAGQDDAQDLRNPVEFDEAEKSTVSPLEKQLPVSSQQLSGATQLDSQGWPCPNSFTPVFSDNRQTDTVESANQDAEAEELFHLFEGSENSIKLSTTTPDDVLYDDLSSPSKPTEVPLNNPILSQSPDEIIARESDSRVSPPSNGQVDVGRESLHLQTLDVPEDSNVDVVEGVAEHPNVFVNVFSVQDSESVAHLSKALECSVDQEALDTTPMLTTVTSNGLFGANIQHLHDGNDASDGSVDLEALDFSPKGASQTPALSDAYMAVQSDDGDGDGDGDDGLDQEEVWAVSVVPTAEMNEGLDSAAKTDDVREVLSEECPLEMDYSQSSPDVASPISEVAAGTDVSHDLVESDENVVIACQSGASAGAAAAKEVEADPLESNALTTTLLPPVTGNSEEEEQTEEIFLLSLASKEETPPASAIDNNEEDHVETSTTPDHELQMNILSQEAPHVSISNEPKESFQDMSSESREDNDTEVWPEHDNNFQTPSGAITVPVEERPQETQSQDDAIPRVIPSPALPTAVESHEGPTIMSEVDLQPQMPLKSTPSLDTLQDRSADDEQTLDEYVLTATEDKSLPAGVHDESNCEPVNVAHSPVIHDQEDEIINDQEDEIINDQEDEIINDQLDSKSEVKSTASVDVGTSAVTTATGATIDHTDTTSSAEMLEEDEAIHSTAVPAVPVHILSAGDLSTNLTLNEVGTELNNNNFGSECTVDESEKWGTIADVGEHGWEEPLLAAADSSGSQSSTEDEADLLSQASMVTNATSTVVADERRATTEDLEVDVDESEEASECSISTPASTPDEILEFHDPGFQESHLLLGTCMSTTDVDQVSGTEAALDACSSVASSDDATTSDEDMLEVALDDHAIEDVEVVRPGSAEHFSLQEMPLELFVASNQDTSAILDVDEMKEGSDLTQETDKEGEEFYGIGEKNPLLVKDEDMAVDSSKKSFTLSSLDTADNMGADEREGSSTLPELQADEERGSSLIESLKEVTVLEDEVVCSPMNAFVASDHVDTPFVVSGHVDTTPDATTVGADDIQNHDSGVPWTAGNDEEESVHENLEEESLLLEDQDGVIYSPPKDNPGTVTKLDGNGIHSPSTAVWKEEGCCNPSLEENLLEENPVPVKDEDMVDEVDSPEKSFLLSKALDTADNVGVDEREGNSTLADEERGSLKEEKTVLEDEEETVVYSPPKDASVASAQVDDTPDATTLGAANDIQNHSNTIPLTAGNKEEESFHHDNLEEESLPEDEHAVIHSPPKDPVGLITAEENLVSTTHVDGNGIHSPSWKEDNRNQSLEENPLEENPLPVKDDEDMVDEDSPKKSFVASGQDIPFLDVDQMEEEQRDPAGKEEKSLNGSLERDSVFEDHGVYSPKGQSNVSAEEAPADTVTVSDVNDIRMNHSTVDDEDENTVVYRPTTVEESTPEVVEKVVDSNNAPDHDTPNAAAAVFVAVNSAVESEQQSTRRADDEEEAQSLNGNVEEESMPETVVDSTIVQPFVVADELEKRPATMTDVEDGESLDQSFVEENSKSMVPAMVEVEEMVTVESSKESFVIVSDEDDANNAEALGAQDLHTHESLHGNHPHEESMQLGTQDNSTSVDSSGDDVQSKELVCLSEENGALLQSNNDYTNGPTDLGAIKLADEGAVEPHGSEVALISPIGDAVHRVENISLVVPGVVHTDTAAKDSDSVEYNRASPAVEESRCNGTKLDVDSNAEPVHETATNLECKKHGTAPTDAPDLVEATEPARSPTAALYPLLKPPFSGSQQDRLWEEQAEAYNSGQGTPSRNNDDDGDATPAAPTCHSPPADDQIQPVAGASNGHAVQGPSNDAGHPNHGNLKRDPPKAGPKEKLHTPLRSLLLEDASHGDSTPRNGVVTSSPSFIRRLFRVMSTPSRSADRVGLTGHTKLKKSSSMWISCLGSPQVQQ